MIVVILINLQINSGWGINKKIGAVTLAISPVLAGGTPTGNLTCSAGTNEITGIVFDDYNYNGVYDTDEFQGIDSIIIIATDSLGNSFSDTTNNAGTYSIGGLTTSRTYRIEFTIPSWASPTFYGGDNGTTVQFVQSGSCANLGLSSGATICDSSDDIAVTCFQFGNQITGSFNTSDVIVSFNSTELSSSPANTLPSKQLESRANQVGSTWGMAYDAKNEQLLAGAFIKRHAGLGSTGNPTTIYSIDVSDATADGTAWFTLDAGRADPHSGDTDTGWEYDDDAFDDIGKEGWGDIDISEDLSTVYGIDLGTRSLVVIPVNVDGSAGTPQSIDLVTALSSHFSGTVSSSANCAASDFQPFGLGTHNGEVYIGAVCSAQSTVGTLPSTSGTAYADRPGDPEALKSYVFKWNGDLVSPMFTKVLEFGDMDYDRGCGNNNVGLPDCNGGRVEMKWSAWVDEPPYTTSFAFEAYPQPILSDIEFTPSGDMILGYIDRFSHQSGDQAFLPNGNQMGYIRSGGDILYAGLVSGSYVIEELISGNPAVGTVGTSSNYAGNVTTDEYFYQDDFHASSSLHAETALGALLYNRVDNEVMSIVYDPRRDNSSAIFENGIASYNLTDGSWEQAVKIFVKPVASTESTGLWGKTAGLGDMAFLCDPAPIEIGNYVWYDEDADGIQNAGETPLEGVRMELYDNTGNLLAFDTTNSHGHYFFSGNGIDDANWQTADDTIQPNTSYYIVAGGGGQFANDTLTLNGQYYALTSDSTATGANQYEIDSDGIIAISIDSDFDGKPYLQITTGSTGDVDHSFDFGFSCFVPTATVFAIQPSCTDGSPNSDGYLQISQVTNGNRYHFSTGNTFDDNGGANTYANATTFTTFPEQTTHNLSNPATTQDYTIRVYNGADDCFTDLVVTLNEQDCNMGCDCKEYIYLDEPTGGGAIFKFKVEMSDSSLQKVGDPWFDNILAGEDVDIPHGVAADVNGFLYVGERGGSGFDIRKFTCDGEIFPESEFVLPTTGQSNIVTIGNTLFYNARTNATVEILGYDICTGNLTHTLDLCSVQANHNDWGFYLDSRTNTFYSTTDLRDGNFTNYVYKYTLDDFNQVDCINPIPLTAPEFPTTNASIRGITTDNDENLYIVVTRDKNIQGDPTYILKFGPAPGYSFLAQSPMDTIADGSGFNNAAGIVYSESTNRIYVAAQSLDDCIAAFDTDLNYLGAAVPQGAAGINSKALTVLKECCPTNNNITIDTTLCTVSIGDSIFLQELINCSGTICEGLWQEGGSNMGMTYSDCNNSVTFDALNACGIFTLESDGVGNNPQCGAFKITVNISVNIVTASIIAGDQTICSGDTLNIFTVNTSAISTNGDTLMYQWQSSIDSLVGYSDIIGADSATYAPPNTLSDTTYFRVIVRSTSAGCASGLCADTSNILTIMVEDCDWGDLPDPNIANNVANYQTLRDSSGPVHIIIPGLHLGSSVDGESNGQPTDNALGDGNDEDGLLIFESLDISPGGIIKLPLNYTNTTGQTAHIEAWIDWNGDGAFDGAGEMVLDVSDTGDSAYDRLEVTVPNDAITEQFLGLRIRISHTDNMTPYGKINSGEIEDYLIGLDCVAQICIPLQTTIIRKE